MKMRKGFTLVELLIVIVIIGILAAAMLMSSGSATASAEASNIVSDLRNMKAALLMFYSDSMDTINTTGFTVSTTVNNNLAATLGRYMDNPGKYTGGKFVVVGKPDQDPTEWYVGFNMAGIVREVQEKIHGKRESTGLLGSANSTTAPANATTYYNVGDGAVWMKAR